MSADRTCRPSPVTESVRLWSYLMGVAEDERSHLLRELADPRSGVRIRFGEELCSVWSVLVRDCIIKWSIRFTRKAGRCRTWEWLPPGSKRPSEIELSWAFFRHDWNLNQFVDTVLHELAHVMTPGAKHSLLWKTVAMQIGCTGDIYHNMRVRPRRRSATERKLDHVNRLMDRIRKLEE